MQHTEPDALSKFHSIFKEIYDQYPDAIRELKMYRGDSNLTIPLSGLSDEQILKLEAKLNKSKELALELGLMESAEVKLDRQQGYIYFGSSSSSFEDINFLAKLSRFIETLVIDEIKSKFTKEDVLNQFNSVFQEIYNQCPKVIKECSLIEENNTNTITIILPNFPQEKLDEFNQKLSKPRVLAQNLDLTDSFGMTINYLTRVINIYSNSDEGKDLIKQLFQFIIKFQNKITKDFNQGAAAEIFSKHLPKDVGGYAGKFFDSQTGKAASLTNKAAHESANKAAYNLSDKEDKPEQDNVKHKK